MAQIGILKIKEIVDGLLLFVKSDYESKFADNLVNESLIYRILDENDTADGIKYRDLAVEIFCGRSKKDSRKIDTRIMFDVDRASLPTIHFREPSKQKGRHDGIGYLGNDILDNSVYNDEDELIIDGYSYVRQRSFESNYEMMITSTNRHEVLIMEEVMIGLLVGASDTLMNIFPTFEFSVKELLANNELIPTPLFIKSLNLKIMINKTYPDLTNNKLLTDILFTKTLL